MSGDIKYLLAIYAFAIAMSIIWFAIHFFLKRKEKKKRDLSAKEKEWMVVSKVAGFLFLILPLILVLIFPLVEKAVGIVIVIFISGVLIFELYKGKKL